MTNFSKIKANKPLFFSILIAIILLLTVLISELLGWPFLKKPLENLMENKLGRSVKIESPFKLNLFGGLKLQANGLWISAPENFDVASLVDAKGVELKLRYKDLWNIEPGDAYVIQSIKADQIEAHLTRRLDGKSTWQFNKDNDDPIRPFPIIQSLVIHNGNALVNDSLTKANLTVFFSTVEGDASIKPQSKVSVNGNFRERPLTSELITYGFLLIASQTKSSKPVSSKGWLQYGKMKMKFDGSVYDLFGKQTIKGKITVNGPSLGDLGDLLSITLPRTTSFTINSSIEKNPERWLIDIASAHIGRSDLYGNFKYDTRPKKAMLQRTLKGKRLFLADLAPAFGVVEEESNKPRAKVFPNQPLDFATYNRMNAAINIDIKYVDLGNVFRAPITPFKAAINLNKSKLSLAKINAKTAQGSIMGDIYIDAHNHKTTNPQAEQFNNALKPNWNINLVVKGINLEKWLQVADDRKKKAKEKSNRTPQSYVTGLLNGQVKLNGKGNSTTQLLGSLNGDLSFYIRNGDISHLVIEAAGLDIAQAAGLLIKGDKNIKMQCAVADFKANKGVMKSNVTLIDTEVTTLLLDGNVDMGEEKLKLRITAKPKNFSPFTVRSPIEITGTFLNPNVSLSKAPIAARVVGGVLLAFVNPLAAIIPFLDPGEGDESKNSACNETLNALKSNIKTHPKK